ncbi:anti-sigma factor antagonist [Pseudonocardia spinosispora]|uniref:anti-sigma factor antagonist n=1 Tax=Pseudonocardia spinosispora TaxID=103441 RepID=UPI000400E47A|nr:anti-sigma factor antagonist [Pseudonocardia spinosispora]
MSDGTSRPSEQLLTLGCSVRAGAIVVVATGELDVLTVPRLRETLAESVRSPEADTLVLDLTDVEFLGSLGLRALVEIAAEAEANDKGLRVVVDSQRPVVRPIMLSGLDRELDLYDSLDDALPA